MNRIKKNNASRDATVKIKVKTIFKGDFCFMDLKKFNFITFICLKGKPNLDS